MDFDQFPDRLKEKCRKWDREKIIENFGEVPEDCIPLWIADMDFQAPDGLLEAMHEAVDIGVFGYTYVYEEFYDCLYRYYKRHHHTELQNDWMILGYGTVGMLHYTVQAFCKEGDSVIIQTPVYSPFHSAITAHGVRCIENPLIIKNNRYQIDFEQFEEQLKAYHPKLYLLCNPHNPSGRVWSKDELVKLLTLCQKYQVLVVSDEVHSGMIYKGEFTSVSELFDSFDSVILLSSPNKKYNLGGLKTSFAIVKNKQIRDDLKSRLSKNSITSPSVFGIIALIQCMNEGESWSDACMGYIEKNYNFVINFIEQYLPDISYMEMESSYLLWIDIRKSNRSSKQFTEELAHEYGVLVESGEHFVNHGEGWIRINLGTQFRNLKMALERVKSYSLKNRN